MMYRLVAILALGCSALAQGGECHTKTVAAVQFNTGLTIVPFAVPVAVPVAVVPNPPIVYGYAYATMPAPPASDATTNPAPAAIDASTVLARHCGECHGRQAAGGLRVFSDDGRVLARLPRQRILEAIVGTTEAAASMPPAGRPQLADEEIRLIREWAKPPLDLEY